MSDETPNGALVPVARPVHDMQADAPVPAVAAKRYEITRAGPVFWSGIDTSTPHGKMLVMKGMGEPDQRKEDVINSVLEVANVLCHPASKTDERTGEVSEFIRTVLFTKDNLTVAFGGEGIFKSAALLCQLWGEPPWSPPLRVRVKQVKTGAGRQLILLEPVF